jgi:hypothetical protein
VIRRNAMAALSWPRIAVAALAIAAALGAFVGFRQHAKSTLPGKPLQIQEPAAPPAASLRYLPTEVQAVLVSLCNGCTFADSNDAWNATDVVVDDRLPRRRLIRTEKQDGKWLIEYEQGGLASFQHTIVLSATPRPALLEGSSCVPELGQECRW